MTQSQNRSDMLTGDCAMDDPYCPSAFSINTWAVTRKQTRTVAAGALA
jgi:hypothetical protein